MSSAPAVLHRLLLVLTLLIVYVSLYPFRFRLEHGVAEPPWSAVDMVANLLLFLPFGLLARWLADAAAGQASAGGWRQEPGPHVRNRLALWLLAGAGLAAGLQWLQVFIPGRLASLMDVGMNWLGLGLGAALAAWLSPQRWQRYGRIWLASAAGMLTLLWLAAQLSPFLPGNPARAWARQSLLFFELPWQWLLFAGHVLAWLILLRLSGGGLNRWLAATVVVLTLALQPWLMGGVLRQEELLAPFAALLLFGLGLRRPAWLFALSLGYLFWRGVWPLALRAEPSFHWLPFGGLLAAPLPFALATLAEKAFWYGCLYELGRRAQWAERRLITTVLIALALIEAGQVPLAHHRAEWTDLLIFGLMVMLLRALPAAPADALATITSPTIRAARVAAKPR